MPRGSRGACQARPDALTSAPSRGWPVIRSAPWCTGGGICGLALPVVADPVVEDALAADAVAPDAAVAGIAMIRGTAVATAAMSRAARMTAPVSGLSR